MDDHRRPAQPDWYSYRYIVDDETRTDPDNDVVATSTGDAMFLISGPGTAFIEESDVRHGAVETLTYTSAVVGAERRATVYTPPGYDAGGERLPLFVLMHGGGGDELDWPVQGRANVILDNLLAAGAIKPMIVAMPNATLPGGLAPSTLITPVADLVPAEIIDNLIPALNERYRVAQSPEQRAVAGLSMGGFYTWSTLIMRPGEFAWYGDFSSGYFPDSLAWLRDEGAYLFDNPKINTQTRLHAIYCDEGDVAWPNNVGTRALFDDMGIDYTFIDVPGTTGHTWHTWRLHLRDFAPRIF